MEEGGNISFLWESAARQEIPSEEELPKENSFPNKKGGSLYPIKLPALRKMIEIIL